MKALGERIKQARIQEGLTQEQLAELLNLSRGTIARYELGEIEPKLQNLAAISDVLHVSTDDLMGLNHSKTVIEGKLSPRAVKALNEFVREIRKEK